MHDKYVDPVTGKTYRKRIRKIQEVDGSITFKEEIEPDDYDYRTPYDDYESMQEYDMAPRLPLGMENMPVEKQVEILRMHYRAVCDMFNQLVSIVNGIQNNTKSSFDYSQKELDELENRMSYLTGELYHIHAEQQAHNQAWHTMLIPAKEKEDEGDIS